MNTYCIEESGKGWIGHWFWYMLGALNKIPEFGKEKIKVCFLDEDWTPYQLETFEILEDKIEVVPYTKDHIYVEHHHPRHAQNNVEVSHIDPSVWLFVKDLFLSSIGETKIEGYDKVYIRRNLSHLSQGNERDTACKNIRRRQILNEDQLVEKLKELDFKIINLEDYHTRDKIRIFHNASVILGPNGGGMCFTFVAKPGTKYIEILPPNPHQYIDMYRDMCREFDLEFHRFQDVKREDDLDNMSVDINVLLSYLKNIL